VLGYFAADAEEAAHFFEHTLGLQLAGEDGGLRFYVLAEGLTLAVNIGTQPSPPYLLFSAADLTAAAEHFLARGCAVRELPWATGAGFLASTPEGHTAAVVDARLMSDDTVGDT